MVECSTPDVNEVVPHYNLQDDLSETRNLAADRPELDEQLNRDIDRFLQETGALVPKPNPSYDPSAVDEADENDADRRPRRTKRRRENS